MSIREIPSPGSDPVGFGDTLNASLRVSSILIGYNYLS